MAKLGGPGKSPTIQEQPVAGHPPRHRKQKEGDFVKPYHICSNPKWLDLLTAFNDELIIYEGQSIVDGEIVGDPTSGNPISYYNGTRWAFTWQNGRQLASASTTSGDTTIDIDYTYDINGLRTSKTITRTTGGTAHTHEYTSAVTAPTCTTAGYTTYTCECGESYVDNLVDALGHNYVQSGNVYTCTRCGDSYTGHEHNYTEETTEPSCTQAGYTIYTCSCGDSYRVNLPALGHDYVMISQDFSGKRTYRCTRCSATYTDSGVGINPPIDPDPPVEYSLRNSNVTVTTEHHEYVYASGKLLREVITTTDAEGNASTQTLDFTYDTSGNPYTLTYNGMTYYYVVNLQGDVIRLVSGTGATVAEYEYDPYGRVSATNSTLAEVNPLRYRGYYYDAETEFYYLQSRYYDPVICRFVNADALASTGQGFLGQNMFAYCNNNPVCLADAFGFAAGNVVTTVHLRDDYSLSYKGTYPTIEDAVKMFASRYYGITRDLGIEMFAFVYEVDVEGQTRYKYGFIHHGYLKAGEVKQTFNVVKEMFSYDGLVIVARVHTHPTDAFDENFSRPDRIAAVGAHSNNLAFEDYLVTQYSIRKFNPADLNAPLFVTPLGYVFSQYYIPTWYGAGNKHGSMTAAYIN